MSFLNKKTTAISVSVLLILASIFVIGANNLKSLKEYVNSEFETGSSTGSLSIQMQIDNILGEGNNMLVVTRRYTDEDELLMPLITAVDNLLKATTPGEKYQATNALTTQISALNSKKELLNMSERDQAYFQSIVSNVESSNRIISNNEYNLMANEFNEIINTFPANIISLVRGINTADLFE